MYTVVVNDLFVRIDRMLEIIPLPCIVGEVTVLTDTPLRLPCSAV